MMHKDRCAAIKGVEARSRKKTSHRWNLRKRRRCFPKATAGLPLFGGNRHGDFRSALLALERVRDTREVKLRKKLEGRRLSRARRPV